MYPDLKEYTASWWKLCIRAGLKFAYQDIDKQRKVEEEKLKQSNPKKAEQMDRLGMGFGNRR